MFKKLRKVVKNYITPLKSNGKTPVLRTHMKEALKMDFGFVIGETQEDVARRNMQRLEVARLEQDRDAINKNLLAQHRYMIATLIAALVALMVGIAAVLIAALKS